MPIPPDNRPGQGPNFQPKRDYQPAVTTEQLGEMINGGVNKLLEAIKQGNTEHLTSYLAFSSRLWKYSPRNQSLIYEQFPAATKVASYATWKAEGFQVRKMSEGEHGIKILVPIPPSGWKAPERRSQRTSEMEKEEKDVRTVGFITTRFKIGSVFDVSHLTQESQERIPSLFTKIDGDHQTTHERIVQVVRADGIRYEESLETNGAMGYSAGGLIVVRSDQPVGNKVGVTLHEYFHEILHKEQERRTLSKQVKECHAEAGAFIVASYLGVELSYSSDYLRNWGNDEKTLRQELDIVTSTASKVIGKLNALEPGKQWIDKGGVEEVN